jgi:hypothetical protein
MGVVIFGKRWSKAQKKVKRTKVKNNARLGSGLGKFNKICEGKSSFFVTD